MHPARLRVTTFINLVAKLEWERLDSAVDVKETTVALAQGSYNVIRHFLHLRPLAAAGVAGTFGIFAHVSFFSRPTPNRKIVQQAGYPIIGK